MYLPVVLWPDTRALSTRLTSQVHKGRAVTESGNPILGEELLILHIGWETGGEGRSGWFVHVEEAYRRRSSTSLFSDLSPSLLEVGCRLFRTCVLVFLSH